MSPAGQFRGLRHRQYRLPPPSPVPVRQWYGLKNCRFSLETKAAAFKGVDFQLSPDMRCFYQSHLGAPIAIKISNTYGIKPAMGNSNGPGFGNDAKALWPWFGDS
jgi:hypothetical protein